MTDLSRDHSTSLSTPRLPRALASSHPPAMSSNGLAPPTGPGALAVIFTSLRTAGDAQTADEMVRLAAGQDGFLGMESARGADGLAITVSYWRDEAAIQAW